MISNNRVILRHVLLSIWALLLFLVLNLPDVILISHLGSVVWYPATGLTLALLLGVSPWYAILVLVAGAMAGKMFYHQPLTTWSQSVGLMGISTFYAAAAHVLRGPLHIDLRLRRQRDVLLYLATTTSAALACAGVGAACLAGDHAIDWKQFWSGTFQGCRDDEVHAGQGTESGRGYGRAHRKNEVAIRLRNHLSIRVA
jgi:hypothetical protein